jgi:hypothetical protein
MRLALAGLTLIIAAALALEALGLAGGESTPTASAALVLVAAGTMVLAAATVFAQPVMAGLLLLLAGLVTIASADAGPRYLVAHGVVTVLLAVLCLITARSRGPRDRPGR